MYIAIAEDTGEKVAIKKVLQDERFKVSQPDTHAHTHTSAHTAHHVFYLLACPLQVIS